MKTYLAMFVVVTLLPSTSFGGVTFYVHKECTGPSFYVEAPESISNFKHKTYKGKCIWMTKTGEEIEHDCEFDFDDKISTVYIDNDERVILFKHRNYGGRSLVLDNGAGCYYIGWRMEDEVSSATVE